MLHGHNFWGFKSLTHKTPERLLPLHTLHLMGLSATTLVVLQTYKDKALHALEHLMLPAMALLSPAPIHVDHFIQQQMLPTIERILPTGTHAPFTWNLPSSIKQVGHMLDQKLAEGLHRAPIGVNLLDESTQEYTALLETASKTKLSEVGNLVNGIHPNPIEPMYALSEKPNQPDPSDAIKSNFLSPGNPGNPFLNLTDKQFYFAPPHEPSTGGSNDFNSNFEKGSEEFEYDEVLKRAATYYQFLTDYGIENLAANGCNDCTFLDKGELNHGQDSETVSKYMAQKYKFEDLLGKYRLKVGLSARKLFEATLKAFSLGLVKPDDPFIQTTNSPYELPPLTPEDENIVKGIWQGIYEKAKHNLGPMRSKWELENQGAYLRKLPSNSSQSLRETLFFAMLRNTPWEKTSFGSIEGDLYNTFIYPTRIFTNKYGMNERFSPSDFYGIEKNLNIETMRAFSSFATQNGMARDDDWFIVR